MTQCAYVHRGRQGSPVQRGHMVQLLTFFGIELFLTASIVGFITAVMGDLASHVQPWIPHDDQDEMFVVV